MIKKILFAGIAILFIAVIGIAGYLYFIKQRPALAAAGNIINAASCSYADVSAAISAASAGDTVAVPAGSCTWTSNLTITKGINLVGAGNSLTIITNTTTNTITITLASDVAIRISGFTFDKGTNLNGTFSAIVISGKKNGSFALTKIRIDNNAFNKGTRAIHAIGWVEGVIDHNAFVNCNIAVGMTGDDNYAWTRTIVAGTANALFIEDNTFTINNSADREPNEAIYHQEGGRTVVRYNTFNAQSYTNGYSLFFDTHGNQKYYTGINSTDFRGQSIIEVYENTFKAHHTYRFMGVRGGSLLIYNNKMSTVSGSPGISTIKFVEEECWQTAFFNPLRTTWPAEDQIMNAFFWNNTYAWNGSSISVDFPDVYVETACEAAMIKKDRDYFLHAPQATGGSEYYTGRAGASNTAPTNGGSDTSFFTASGANAYYPYTPYTYPHPLTITPPLKGDFNADSKVNDLDFTSFKNAFKSIFNSLFDLNSDGAIDVKDLGVLMSSWLP